MARKSILEQATDIASAASTMSAEDIARSEAMREDLVDEATTLTHDLTTTDTFQAPTGHVAVTTKLTPNQKRRLPWATVGMPFTGPMTAAEAVARAGAADIQITTRAMGWLDETTMEFTPTDGVRSIVRQPYAGDPEALMLGTCSNTYALLQNSAIAEALDRSGITTRFPVTHVAVTDNGGGLMIVQNLGNDDLLGESYQRFALWRERRDGMSALTCETFYFRLACLNGLSYLDSQATRITLRHTENLSVDLALTGDVIDLVATTAQDHKRWLEGLAEVSITDEDINRLFEATYPMPVKSGLVRQLDYLSTNQMDPAKLARAASLKKQYEHGVAQRTALIATAHDCYQRLITEYPIHKGTMLGGLQAVAEVADHSRMAREGSLAGLDGYRAQEKVNAAAFLATLS